MEETYKNEEYYFFIDVLRSVACCFVVFHHCLFYFPDSSLRVFYIAHLKYFFPTVPTYLVVSGFVQSMSIDKMNKVYSEFVLDKIKRIMVPYFIISLITFVFSLIVERLHLIQGNQINSPINWRIAGLHLFFSGIEGHYYFLEMLFIYLLFFPFIVKKIQTATKALVFFVVIVLLDIIFAKTYMGMKGPTWSPLDLVVSIIAGIKFFIFGFFLSRSYVLIKPYIIKNGGIVGPALIFIYAFLHLKFPIGNEYWFLLLVFTYFSLALVFFNKPILLVKQISIWSFGIYILHQPYFIRLSRIMLSPLKKYPNLMLLSAFTLTIYLTSFAVKLLMKYRYCSLLILGTIKTKKERSSAM